MVNLITIFVIIGSFVPVESLECRLFRLNSILEGKLLFYSTLPFTMDEAGVQSSSFGYTLYFRSDTLTGGEASLRGYFNFGNFDVVAEPYLRRGKWGEYPRREWQGLLSGGFKRLYIARSGTRFIFLIGKEKIAWGSGYPHSLILSGTESSRDMLLLGLKGRNCRFFYFFSPLEVIPRDTVKYTDTLKYNRYLAGHRITFRIKNFLLGFSETTIFGGLARFPDFTYLNPIYPFYLRQYYRGDNNSNTLWAFDFLTKYKSSFIFLDLLIDDFPYKSSHGETPKMGLSTGLSLSMPKRGLLFNVSLTAVNSWVYHHKSYWLNYAYMGDPLGVPEGSNFALLHFDINKKIGEGFFTFYLEEKVYSYQDFETAKPMLGDTVLFLEGNLDRSLKLGFEYLFKKGNRLGLLGMGFAIISPYEGESYRTTSLYIKLEKW